MQAVILAGGKGSRLAPWCAPKCLMPVNGVTILQRLLKHLSLSVNKIVICTGYRANDVKASVYEHFWCDKVSFSDSGEDAAMGKRLLEAKSQITQDLVIICYGDDMADVNIPQLLEAHKDKTMTFTAYPSKKVGGTVSEKDNTVRIIEDQASLINIGFVLVSPPCWQYLKETDGLSDWINRVAENEPLGMYKHTGKRATINTLADIKSAEEVWL